MNKELEEVMNDDLLRCKIIETKKGEDETRADLILWEPSGIYEVVFTDRKLGRIITIAKFKDKEKATKYFEEWTRDTFK